MEFLTLFYFSGFLWIPGLGSRGPCGECMQCWGLRGRGTRMDRPMRRQGQGPALPMKPPWQPAHSAAEAPCPCRAAKQPSSLSCVASRLVDAAGWVVGKVWTGLCSQSAYGGSGVRMGSMLGCPPEGNMSGCPHVWQPGCFLGCPCVTAWGVHTCGSLDHLLGCPCVTAWGVHTCGSLDHLLGCPCVCGISGTDMPEQCAPLATQLRSCPWPLPTAVPASCRGLFTPHGGYLGEVPSRLSCSP